MLLLPLIVEAMTSRKGLRQHLFERDGSYEIDPMTGRKRWYAMCAFGCGTVLTDDTATIDHYPIPQRLGGRWKPDNTRLACAPCNNADGGRAPQPPVGLTRGKLRRWWRQRCVISVGDTWQHCSDCRSQCLRAVSVEGL